MLISRDALAFVFRVVFSCYRIMDIEDRKKLPSFLDFLRNGSQVYSCVHLTCGNYGKTLARIICDLSDLTAGEMIDTTAVAKYFGGKNHLDFIKTVFQEHQFNVCEYDVFYLTHILLPVTLEEDSSSDMIYRNDGISIKLVGLTNPFDLPISRDNVYYTHFDVIVASALITDPLRACKLRWSILYDQLSDCEFATVAKKHKTINWCDFNWQMLKPY